MLHIQQHPYHKELTACLALVAGITGGAVLAFANAPGFKAGPFGFVGFVAGASTSSEQSRASTSEASKNNATQPSKSATSSTSTATTPGSSVTTPVTSGLYSAPLTQAIGGMGGGGDTAPDSGCFCETIGDTVTNPPVVSEPVPAPAPSPLQPVLNATDPVLRTVQPATDVPNL